MVERLGKLCAKQRQYRDDPVNQDAIEQVTAQVQDAGLGAREQAEYSIPVELDEGEERGRRDYQDCHPAEQQQRIAWMKGIGDRGREHEDQSECDDTREVLQVDEKEREKIGDVACYTH